MVWISVSQVVGLESDRSYHIAYWQLRILWGAILDCSCPLHSSKCNSIHALETIHDLERITWSKRQDAKNRPSPAPLNSTRISQAPRKGGVSKRYSVYIYIYISREREKVVANAKAMADELMSKGHKLASDGTDNHLILWDLRPHGLTGSKLEKVTSPSCMYSWSNLS